MRAIKLVDVKDSIEKGVTPEEFSKDHGVSLEYTLDLFKLVKRGDIKGEFIVLPQR